MNRFGVRHFSKCKPTVSKKVTQNKKYRENLYTKNKL